MPDLTVLGDLAPALAATAFRAAVALAVVAIVQLALTRRASAATRHALWVAAFGVVLVLSVAEHPAVREAAPTSAQIRTVLPLPAVDAQAPPPTLPTPTDALPTPSEPTYTSGPATPDVASPERSPLRPRVPWATLFVGVWAVGALAALLRLAVSVVVAMLAVRRAVSDPALSAQIGVPVHLSSTATVPYAWGLWRPVVVVPADFPAWPEPDRRAALAHEAAHAQRRDPLVGVLARFVRALHWPDPFAHYAVRRLDRERERAADDAVLRGDLDATDYADLLVRSARRAFGGHSAPRLAPAHAAPGRSALAERIGAVLDGNAQRGALSRVAGLGTSALALALVAVLSAFGTTGAPDPPAPGTSPPYTVSAPAWYRPPPTAEQWAPRLHSTDGWTYTPTFTPDLRTAYFVLWHAPDYTRPATSIQELYVTRWSDASGSWSEPERVTATAGWRTDWPHVSPDGRLFLSSNKPHDGHYRYPDGRPADDFDLWAADLDADGDLEAATLSPLRSPYLNRQKTPENARIGYVHNETAPRTDLEGRLYFWTERLDDGGGRRDLYLAEPDGTGAWREPELLPFNTSARESGVAADPGGRWIIIASEGRGGAGHSDLFVVARDGEGWAEPVNLGPEVNTRHREDSPEVSPDGRALFFSTNRPGPGIPTVDSGEGVGPAATVHWVDLNAVPAFVRTTGAR